MSILLLPKTLKRDIRKTLFNLVDRLEVVTPKKIVVASCETKQFDKKANVAE